jgi:hypothetical protein
MYKCTKLIIIVFFIIVYINLSTLISLDIIGKLRTEQLDACLWTPHWCAVPRWEDEHGRWRQLFKLRTWRAVGPWIHNDSPMENPWKPSIYCWDIEIIQYLLFIGGDTLLQNVSLRHLCWLENIYLVCETTARTMREFMRIYTCCMLMPQIEATNSTIYNIDVEILAMQF